MLLSKGNPCKAPGCKKNRVAGGYCMVFSHQSLRTDSQYLRRIAKQEEKRRACWITPKEINKISAKQKERNKKFKPIRDEFMSRPENKMCRMYPHLKATQLHHARGKIGDLLFDERWFIALSEEGHRFVEEHPNIAKEMFLSATRAS